jgi:hypothetical protein
MSPAREPGMRPRLPRTCAALLLLALSGCSQFTSIDRDTNGDYVLTGNQGGSGGFVWVCSYDPQTMTMTVKQKYPR